jgi:hypothetical protein
MLSDVCATGETISDNTYTFKITWTFKMTFACWAHVLVFKMILVCLAVGDPPTIFFIAAITDDSMAGMLVVLSQRLPR